MQPMCFYSNRHHGTRGLDPTSSIAEAQSSYPPPPAASIPQPRKETQLGTHTTGVQGGLWPGVGHRLSGLNIRYFTIDVPAKGGCRLSLY